jgi:protocatechuate 3,4-dioxygenase beta subunit
MNRTGEYRARDGAAHPPALAPGYRTSVLRSPRLPPLALQQSLSEVTGPVFGPGLIRPLDADLLLNARVDRDPIGERIVVLGRVLDGDARPVPGALVEVWQANAGGRYRHARDRYVAALDPNFAGCGRTLSGADGGYRFRTVKPGPYPWRNGPNDWRPAHIHLSVFGRSLAQRLVTQLYFEGDPLLRHDRILGSIADPAARDRLVARLDLGETVPLDAIAYRFDVVLRGRRQTPFENRPEGA